MDSLKGAAIALDLDGTLIDTAPDLMTALNKTLALEGLAAATLAQSRAYIGQGARRMIDRAARAVGVAYDDAALDRLTGLFIDFYRQDIASQSRPFEGCETALAAMRDAGAALVVCTNKRTALSRMLLDALNMTPWFVDIVGADRVINRKPHGDHVREAVRIAGADPSRAVMIGDSSADTLSARDAGVRSIAVSFGYNDAAPQELGADAVIDHFTEVPSVAARLLRAA